MKNIINLSSARFWLLLIITLFSFESYNYLMHITLSIQPPNKKYSLLRISKSFDGAFIVKKLVTISSSDKDPLQSGKAEIMFRIRSESQKKCDESIPPFPTNTTVLKANGKVIIRKDGLAHFSGNFEITDLLPENEKLLFKGTIEMMSKIGSHQSTLGNGCAEQCDEDGHLEGWLIGTGVRQSTRYSIRAIVVTDISENLPKGGTFPANAKIVGIITSELNQ